jgi:cytochrome c-type biogenesis protein CcmH/NrfG
MNFTRLVALLIVAITALTLIGFFRHERAQEQRRLALAAGPEVIEEGGTLDASEAVQGDKSSA